MERRIYPRFSINAPVKIETKDPKTNINICRTGEITNLSLGGAGLSINTILPETLPIMVWANITPSKPPLSTEARIKWTNKDHKDSRFQHGLEFIDPDTNLLSEILQDINIQNVEEFFKASLPNHIKKNYVDSWIFKKLDQEEIMKIIAFSPPFLKIEKVIIFDTYKNSSIMQARSLGTGIMTREDTKGHYNDTIFLAICARLMGQVASIHLATLNPWSAPQVVEANHTEPLISGDDYLWQPNLQGSRFFVEVAILKKRLHLVIVNVKVSFGDLVMGTLEELKIVLTPKDVIQTAKELPLWK